MTEATTPNVRSPCRGICSTTHGDNICRGCRRLAVEVDLWSGMDSPKRSKVMWRIFNQAVRLLNGKIEVIDREKAKARLRMFGRSFDDSWPDLYLGWLLLATAQEAVGSADVCGVDYKTGGQPVGAWYKDLDDQWQSMAESEADDNIA